MNNQASTVEVTGIASVNAEPSQTGMRVNDQFIRPWPSSPGTSARSTSQIQSERLVTARDWPERRAIGVLSAVAQSAVAAVYSSGLIDCWVRLENTK